VKVITRSFVLINHGIFAISQILLIKRMFLPLYFRK